MYQPIRPWREVATSLHNIAEQTLVCLSSPLSLRISKSLSWLKEASIQLRNSLDINADYIDYMTSPDDEAIFGLELLAASFGFRKNGQLRAYLKENLHRPEFLEDWLGVYDVLASPWHGRAWTCQEIRCFNSSPFHAHWRVYIQLKTIEEGI